MARTGHVYTPAKTAQYEKIVGWHVRSKWTHSKPYDGALVVTLVFHIVKKPHSKLGVWPTGVPDTDNLVKAVTDAIQGICFINDSQIVEIHAKKVWSSGPAGSIFLQLTGK
jgi:Holliday junction resolvase RusA-like endonuclease